ncbi:hypothetical protein [Actinoallomurus sp. NPDC052274]
MKRECGQGQQRYGRERQREALTGGGAENSTRRGGYRSAMPDGVIPLSA